MRALELFQCARIQTVCIAVAREVVMCLVQLAVQCDRALERGRGGVRFARERLRVAACDVGLGKIGCQGQGALARRERLLEHLVGAHQAPQEQVHQRIGQPACACA